MYFAIIIIACFSVMWFYPMSFPFSTIVLAATLKDNVSIEDAVVTKEGIMTYREYQRNSHQLSGKLKQIKAIRIKKFYFALHTQPIFF